MNTSDIIAAANYLTGFGFVELDRIADMLLALQARAEAAEKELAATREAHADDRLQNDREWRAKLDHLKTENWQLRQALGYPIPADKETPQNPFKCGTCEASHIRAEAAEKALVQAADIADSFRCGSCGMDGKAGAAIRAALEAKP